MILTIGLVAIVLFVIGLILKKFVNPNHWMMDYLKDVNPSWAYLPSLTIWTAITILSIPSIIFANRFSKYQWWNVVLCAGVLVIMVSSVVAHEYGHYIIAKEHGLNPRVNVLPFYTGGLPKKTSLATVFHIKTDDLLVDRQILFAGLYGELVVIMILFGIVAIRSFYTRDAVLFWIGVGGLILLFWVLTDWYIFDGMSGVDKASDAYKLFCSGLNCTGGG